MTLLKILHFRVNSFIRNFSKCQYGVTAIEYTILGAAVVAVLSFVFHENGELHQALVNIFNRLSNNVLNDLLH